MLLFVTTTGLGLRLPFNVVLLRSAVLWWNVLMVAYMGHYCCWKVMFSGHHGVFLDWQLDWVLWYSSLCRVHTLVTHVTHSLARIITSLTAHCLHDLLLVRTDSIDTGSARRMNVYRSLILLRPDLYMVVFELTSPLPIISCDLRV